MCGPPANDIRNLVDAVFLQLGVSVSSLVGLLFISPPLFRRVDAAPVRFHQGPFAIPGLRPFHRAQKPQTFGALLYERASPVATPKN
jgi:hypothetical protein